MCGFLISNKKNKTNITEAINSMSYRGLPEHLGYQRYFDYDLAHVSLPMIKEKTIQPIKHQGEPPTMLVGEIFNYKNFGKYETDAEMLNSKWNNKNDFEMFHKFDGFWSFIGFHKNKPIIFTDFLGIKPVYYRLDKDVAASEINVLKEYGSVTRNEVFHSNVLKWGYDPTGGTPWNEIKQLKPGHFLYERNEIPYWNWFKVPVTDLYNDLNLSVQYRASGFRKVALLLSGGLDSTIIYSLLKENGCDVTTIHVENDESRYAQLVDDDYIKVELDNVGLSESIAIHQTPVDLGSVKPQIAMARKLKELGFHNVITGDGADELFGGYSRSASYDSQYSDVFIELPYYHLPKLDRTMMRYTIELRAPFLSPSVIAHALHLPYNQRNGEKKVLKRLFGGLVPDPILNRDKHALKSNDVRYSPIEQRDVNETIWWELNGR